jgi:hypothetical protein
MAGKRRREKQVVYALRQVERGKKVSDVCREEDHRSVQLVDLLLEELQSLRCHLEQTSVHGLEVCARAERITQLFRRERFLPEGEPASEIENSDALKADDQCR